MRNCVKRLTAVLLAVLVLTGGVCTQAAYYVQATRPGDPNPTRRDLTYEETQTLYAHSLGVAVRRPSRTVGPRAARSWSMCRADIPSPP